MKSCICCGVLKEDLEFGKYKTCSRCREVKKQYRLNHQKETKEYNNNYKKENKEKLKEYSKEYNNNHKEEKNEYNKKYAEEHKEEISERKKELYQNGYKEVRKQLRQENAKKYAETRRLYRENNISKELYLGAKARAKEENVQFTISLKYLDSIFPVDNICPITGVKLSVGTFADKNNSFSLNRIDVSKGYIEGNVQIISYKAACIKGKSTLTELEKFYNYKIQEEHDINHPKMNEILIYRKIFIDKDYNQDAINNIMNVEKVLLKRAANRAREGNLAFDLDLDYIKSIFPLDNCCPVFNAKFDYTKDFSAALDKIDPQKGYVKGNVVIISRKAADIKKYFSLQDFLHVVSCFRNYYDKTGTGIVL